MLTAGVAQPVGGIYETIDDLFRLDLGPMGWTLDLARLHGAQVEPDGGIGVEAKRSTGHYDISTFGPRIPPGASAARPKLLRFMQARSGPRSLVGYSEKGKAGRD